MKLSSNRLRLFAMGALLAATIGVAAAPVLRHLKIIVELQDNGDAHITELRQMSIDDEGTECYIVVGNLNGSSIKDFKVRDERQQYVDEGAWNVNRSRQQKAGRYGIVSKADGCELCWGLGSSGERFYLVEYTVTGLVRAYEESDGFNWMFITRDMNPSPQMADVTISAPQSEAGLPSDTVKAWAFGFGGKVMVADSIVRAYTTQPMRPQDAMIVMVELPKGLLHPAMAGNGSFEDVRRRAFEGSDYNAVIAIAADNRPWYRKAWDGIVDNFELFCLLLFSGFIVASLVWAAIHKRMERKKLLKTVDWYREIPANGDLVCARSLYNAFYLAGGITTEDLIGAMVLRLLRTGVLRIENLYVDATGLKKMFGGKGKQQDCIVIGDFNDKNRLINTAPIRKLYNMMRAASGEDLILQPNELKKWMRKNEEDVMSFMKSIDKSMSIKEAKRSIDDVRKVFGLKKFLEDFTLANERHLSEVALWNDYLIYATLFGIADQVKADMMKVNPEFLQMNEIARSLTNETVVPVLMTSTYSSAHSVVQAVNSRDSGGGGSSSFGGGGGFSGGGSGGGVR